MLEQYEEAIEQWWFKHYAKKKDTLLHTYLCIDRVSGGTNLHIFIREHSLKWLLYRNNPTSFERTVGAQQLIAFRIIFLCSRDFVEDGVCM